MAVVPHGVRLSLGGAEPLDPVRVTHLAACAAALDAPLVSEHVAFVRAGGREAGHLLPLPRSRAALDVLSAHVRSVQAELDVPLALEPIAALFDWPDDEYTEGEFLTALLERTGALLLLDVANVYANAVNRGTDPEALFDAIPLDRVAYVHVAGGAEHAADPGVYHDTHTDPVPPAVLALLERLRERLDVAPAVMLERDGRYPPAATLRAELDAIAAAAALPSATRADPVPPAQPRFPVPPHDPRVARSRPASCAFRYGESCVSSTRLLHPCTRDPIRRPSSPPGRPSSSRPWSRVRPTPPASTATGSPSPGAPWCASGRARWRRCGRCWPHRWGRGGTTPSRLTWRVARPPAPCATAGTSPGTLRRAGAERRGRRRARRTRGDPASRRPTATAAGRSPVWRRDRRADRRPSAPPPAPIDVAHPTFPDVRTVGVAS